MAKFSFTIFDAGGLPQAGQTVRVKIAGTATIVASTVSSETGGAVTILDIGNGLYITYGTFSPYLSSGALVTGKYDVYKGTTAQNTEMSHIAEGDVTGALKASNNLSELTASAATARANIGLVIGTNVEAYDADNAIAAAFVAGWLAVGATYPFAHYSGGSFAFLSASGMRTALGLGTAALLDTEEVQLVTISTSAPPTASSDYVAKFWCRNNSTEFSMYVCVRTNTSAYVWRLLQCLNAGSTDRENIFYTYGGA